MIAMQEQTVQPSLIGRRHFAVGQRAYCLEWHDTTPVLVEGEIVALDEKTITLEEADGMLFSARRCAPTQAAYHDPREAIHAELEWLRWCAPYSAMSDAEGRIRRARRLAALMELWRTLAEARQHAAPGNAAITMAA